MLISFKRIIFDAIEMHEKNGEKKTTKNWNKRRKKIASRLLSRLSFFLFFIFILPDYCIRNSNHHRFIFQQQCANTHTHTPDTPTIDTHNASKVVCGDGGMHRLPYMVKNFRQTVAFHGVSTHWTVSNSTSTIIKSPLYARNTQYMNQPSSSSSWNNNHCFIWWMLNVVYCCYCYAKCLMPNFNSVCLLWLLWAKIGRVIACAKPIYTINILNYFIHYQLKFVSIWKFVIHTSTTTTQKKYKKKHKLMNNEHTFTTGPIWCYKFHVYNSRYAQTPVGTLYKRVVRTKYSSFQTAFSSSEQLRTKKKYI